MNGPELRERRKLLGYTQRGFLKEIGVRSRQTLITWEKSDAKLPRLVELAVLALEKLPECRLENLPKCPEYTGKGATAAERKMFDKSRAEAPRGDCLPPMPDQP